jgi:hypothetical protein
MPISGLGSSSIGRPQSAVTLTYDGVPTCSVSIMEVADGLVTHETQYFADPFEAPAGRAALAESIPAQDGD